MSLSTIQTRFLKEALQQKRRIGVGIWRPEPEVVDSLYLAAGFADLTVVGCDLEGLNCIPTKDDDEASVVLIDLLKDKKIDGLVRAQVKDSYTHSLFIEKIGADPKIKNIPIMAAKDDYYFILSNASNYNSLDVEHQKMEAERAARYMKDDLGIEPKIGVMSTRRLTGRVGEFGLIEQVAKNCEETASHLKNLGYDVKEYYIEYERAIWEKRNLMIASSGMVGNTWIKSLTYLGGWTLIQGPYLDQGAYYDDCPRNNNNWFWPIVSTAAWINRDNNKLNNK